MSEDGFKKIDNNHLEKLKQWEKLEGLKLKIVADEGLRSSFVGFDDLNASAWKIPDEQKRTLHRIASTRTNGVTQRDLAKELGIKPNKFFYHVRYLEAQQLIVKRSALVREKEVGNEVDSEVKNSAVAQTQLLQLYRYSKFGDLNTHQRVEITKPACLNILNIGDVDETHTEYMKENTRVNNFLPEMKAICDKLDETNEKVLVVADIKVALNYREAKGHRAWRNIVHRLENAGLVNKFQAKVNGKDVQCLRLLKKFDPNDFQSKPKHDGCDNDNSVKNVKRGYATDQLLELPVENCVYDMVDAEGRKGITLLEISKRLGLNSKKMYDRISAMCRRFGMCMECEKPNRSVLYRIWTRKNYNRHCTNFASANLQDEKPLCSLDKNKSDEDINSNKPKSLVEEWEVADDIIVGKNGAKLRTNNISNNSCILASERHSPILPLNSKQRHWRLISSTDCGTRREQLIIERLEECRFVLLGQLYKWLKDSEKDVNTTTLDRKTLDRTLKNLQKHGLCKISQVSIPALTNYNQNRELVVILHPTVESKEIMDQIYKSHRTFEFQSRSHEFTKSTSEPLPVLTNIERPSIQTDDCQASLDAMRANGYVPSKMICAKLFHQHLWNISSLSNSNKKDHKKIEFDMKYAIEAMPLELFSQIVGVAKEINDMVDKCKRGLKLMDLSKLENRSLLDTKATGRLSRLIDILIRLKLICLECQELKGAELHTGTTPNYVMELESYIEEPSTRVPSSFKVSSSDPRPRVRHNFVFSNKEDVEAYWQTLEYCYANADPASAKLSFPGTAVSEVFRFRSWASVRVMTAVQRAELLKRMKVDDNIKVPFNECVNIARELNLSVDQVLRVSYDKQQRRMQNIYFRAKKSKEQQNSPGIGSEHAFKRRRCSIDRSINCSNDAEGVKASCSDKLSIAPFTGEYDMDIDPSVVNDTKMQDNSVDVCTDNIHDGHAVEDLHEADEQSYSLIRNRVFSTQKPVRKRSKGTTQNRKRKGSKRTTQDPLRKRFKWTDELDREIVATYARECVMLGDRFYHVKWSSLKNLPTDPLSCGRRMNKLKSDRGTRRAVMKLCNLLTERYKKYLQNLQTELAKVSQEDTVENQQVDLNEQDCWDDFEDPEIKLAFEEVLRCKRLAKLEPTNKPGSKHAKDWKDTSTGKANTDVQENTINKPCGDPDESETRDGQTKSYKRPKKLPDSSRILIYKRVNESTSVANAVELLKLVFLSNLKSSGLQSSLAETLQLYPKSDIIAAFNYLKDKEYVVVGNEMRGPVLTQFFWRGASSSPFPVDSGKRAANFLAWFLEQNKDLEDEIDLCIDIYCGELYQICALLSSEDLFISPSLPEEGTGEADESKSSRLDTNDEGVRYPTEDNKSTSLGKLDSDFTCRREKGFPGIKVISQRTSISKGDAFSCLSDNRIDRWSNTNTEVMSCAYSSSSQNNFCNHAPPYVEMTVYAELFVSSIANRVKSFTLSPETFRSVYSIIDQAGEQGLNIKEVSNVIGTRDLQISGVLVNTFEVFNVAFKVMAFDSVRLVSSTYRSKYFVRFPMGHHNQDINGKSQMKDQGASYKNVDHADANDPSTTEGHNVSVSDFPSNNGQPQVEREPNTENVTSNILDVTLEKLNEPTNKFAYHSILPWINCDGSSNTVIYTGLRRRVLGTVMQNPGILEEDIIHRMDVLNPQTCLKLIEVMILDGHIFTKTMYQTASASPPSMLQSFFSSDVTKPNSVCRKHYFANPKSVDIL